MEPELGLPSSSKRNRSTNWSEEERILLTRIIKKRIEIIENKDVSKQHNEVKKRAWAETMKEFNELNSTYRDLTQLMNQWRNTKNNLKKRDYQYRQAQKAPAGVPPPPQEDVEIMELMPEFSMENNAYDSDYKQENGNTSYNNFSAGETTCSPSTPAGTATQARAAALALSLADSFAGREKKKNANNFEEEIFKLAKTEREEKIQQARERHQMKMQILALEKEYWQNKIQNITEKDY